MGMVKALGTGDEELVVFDPAGSALDGDLALDRFCKVEK